MLKVFFGTDSVAVRKAALDAGGTFEVNGATVTLIDGESYVEGVLRDAVGATSLFGGREVYVLDTPSGNKVFEAEVKNGLVELSESENIFLIIEGALLAADKKKYEKHAETTEEFKGEKADRFDVFALSNFLADRDKKNLWLHLTAAKAAGIQTEEIIGILWWQLKSLRLAAMTENASEAGMKDFPYNKAKRAVGKFTGGELETLSRSLLTVYHDGHLGKKDIDLALEKWALSL